MDYRRTIFPKTDILKGCNDVEDKGYTASKTLDEMIQLALENDCPVIVKGGVNAKWYLKGKGMSMDSIRELIRQNHGKAPREGITLTLIEK